MGGKANLSCDVIGSSIGIAWGPLFATLRDKELGSSVAVKLRYIRFFFSVLKKMVERVGWGLVFFLVGLS